MQQQARCTCAGLIGWGRCACVKDGDTHVKDCLASPAGVWQASCSKALGKAQGETSM